MPRDSEGGTPRKSGKELLIGNKSDQFCLGILSILDKMSVL